MRTAAYVVGVVFLALGVAGFVPGLTTNHDALRFAGDSEALLFGVFAVSVLHNIIHLLIGVWGVVTARSVRGASLFLVSGGVFYMVLWFYGLVVGTAPGPANFLPINTADGWLHLCSALVMTGLGFALTRKASQTRPPSGS
ncbi:DUF4383 domain-containing protein [Actinosynnema sp. NPDC023587]|uniref:DUF4383 domain-containing protein n=1 Tax=Actinosynnema sp. NPDC023587 TaxID=3154695 RepID=UPI0033C9BD91